jgi:hypothetical protein
LIPRINGESAASTTNVWVHVWVRREGKDMVVLLDRDGNVFDGYAVYPAASAPSPPRSLLEMVTYAHGRAESESERVQQATRTMTPLTP